MDTKIILIRHGESLGNATKTYLGHTDVDLSELGKKQAAVAAKYFEKENISAIYSSDLLRAYNTAVPHAQLHSLPIIKSQELREVHVGDWEGKKIDEIRRRWPNEFEVEWKGKFGSMAPPNGENVYAAGKRMHDKLLSIAKEQDGLILVTAHGAVIRAFWCYISGVEPELWAEFVPFPSNASASFVGFDGEKFYGLKYSFDDYLGDMITTIREA